LNRATSNCATSGKRAEVSGARYRKRHTRGSIPQRFFARSFSTRNEKQGTRVSALPPRYSYCKTFFKGAQDGDTSLAFPAPRTSHLGPLTCS
jgi:hypothetical protein